MAEFTVEVNLPNVPEGADVHIPGLGGYKNGGTYGIDDDMVYRYTAENVIKDEDHEDFGKDPMSLLNPPEGIKIYPSSASPDRGNTGDAGNKSEEGTS